MVGEDNFKDPVEDFFIVIDNLRDAYYENIRLKEEIKNLKEEKERYHKQIMEMARTSEEGLHNWINAILDGKLKVVG